ncbi:ketopantoate reductase family protein [Chloroflexota bacterium]
MNKNIGLLATGAIGSSIGADLTRAGYNVMLIDQWPAHVEAMKAHGLHVSMLPEEEFRITVKAIHLCELASLKPQFDIVFLTSKSYDTLWMVELIKPYLKLDGVLVSMQNSMNDEWIAPLIGRERDIGCALELSAEVFDPGLVQRDTDRATTRFVIGDLDGKITPHVQEVAQLLSIVGNTEVSTNIWGAKWTKLVFNTMNSALGSIGGIKSSEMIQNPKCVDFAIKMGKEAVQVGAALGYDLEPIMGMTAQNFVGSTDEALRRMLVKVNVDLGSRQHPAPLQDLLKGRRTEVPGYLNGLVVLKGREVNVPTPYNEVIASLVLQIEEGKLKMERSNLEILDKYI